MPPSIRDRLAARATRAAEIARAARSLASPAASLARVDVSAMRAWARNVRAVEETLGGPTSRAYSRVVVATAEHDADLARLVAFTLPDHLARVPEPQRGRYVKLLLAVLRDRPAALPLVVRTLPDLLERFDDLALARYLSRGLELHEDSARKAESFLRLESGAGRKEAAALARGVSLLDVQRALSLYARAHCGESVQVRPAEGRTAFSDGRHIYLPPLVDRFGDSRDRLVYRVLTARAAGYIEFGTLQLDLETLPGPWPDPRPEELEQERLMRAFPNSALARDLFGILENLRVEAAVRLEYPGVARDMDALAAAHDQGWREERPDPQGLAPAEQAIEWLARCALGLPEPVLSSLPALEAARAAAPALNRVREPGATVAQTVLAMQQAFPYVYGLLKRAEEKPRPDLGGDGPDGSGAGGSGEEEGESPPRTPAPMPGTGEGRPRPPAEEELSYQPMAADPFGASVDPGQMEGPERGVESRALELLRQLRQEGSEAELSQARQQARDEGSSYEEMAAMLERMEAPSGAIIEGRDPERIPVSERPETRGLALDPDVEARPHSHLYPEWDAGIEDHKPAWVRVTEYSLLPGSSEFVRRVRDEHGPLIAQVRRSFEALRPEGVRRLRGVPDGDEIDLERWVEAITERRAGGSPSDRLYTRHQPRERDVSVAFLIDMSSSTNELANGDGKRIIDVEKQALVLIAEAVDAIGDACAIWGFSGYGRDQVAFYEAKGFEDAWDDRARERVGRMTWKMENRDGAAIRHATHRMKARKSKIKLLILLSDGKPLDCGCDHYSDRYAQEDTRVALVEARKAGVHPFCITVDPQGGEYLARTYGEGGYTVINRVEALPQRLPLIYRRLTR
jgi:nitric oxide reductase NorD protein